MWIFNRVVYTDFLIIGEDGRAFSWKGDSGKVIVTDDDDHRPVALLWGGWQERLRQGHEQEIWSYAIDLGKVLDRLDLALLD
jgi:WD40 repeat protein